ncbi:RDD family [Pediococcus pentosaceus]|nr:hypothetical protein CKK51_00885 [Pediococcus pentosaceus]KAF0519207.1 RDD family protein [Pediococcus pentosaceus]MCS8575104.1 RDD family protein [Pediococcus pentosaceus]MCS8578650.1 RDD family protein [Pediococcus pentosaceus]MCT3033594.1 RDD family protein [Pediococcus pentosaceus]
MLSYFIWMEDVRMRDNNDLKSKISNKRIYAFFIDWVFGGVLAGLPSMIIYSVLTGESTPLTSMYEFELAGISKEITILVLLICFFVGVFYYLIIPWKIYPGQTVGKKIVGLKIISLNSKCLCIKTYFIRQFIFLILIEGVATPISTYIKVFITTLTRIYVDPYLNLIWNILTIVSIGFMCFGKNNLCLHDYFAKTTVIEKSVELHERGQNKKITKLT